MRLDVGSNAPAGKYLIACQMGQSKHVCSSCREPGNFTIASTRRERNARKLSALPDDAA
jgi:hypothetical protein